MITLDDWGFPIIGDCDVPEYLIGEAREAVRVSPKLALRLESRSTARSRPQQLRSFGKGYEVTISVPCI